jgi:hypothetical protein
MSDLNEKQQFCDFRVELQRLVEVDKPAEKCGRVEICLRLFDRIAPKQCAAETSPAAP